MKKHGYLSDISRQLHWTFSSQVLLTAEALHLTVIQFYSVPFLSMYDKRDGTS
uniref:Uncharacterized protein n=1 Tax=Anguilla anguilla TaxID=7936 RepID=A0A0E9XL25_ANGAN